MGDNVTFQTAAVATPPNATVVASDEVQVGGTQPLAQVQWMKICDGTPNGTGYVPATTANGLLVDVSRVAGVVHVDDNAGSLTVDGPLTDTQLRATAVPVTIPTPTPVTDNAGSLTVDAPVGTPVWARLSDGAAALIGQKTMANSLPVTVASDQAAVPVLLAANLASEVSEDGPDSGAHSSMLVAGVRNDAAAVKTSADGDYGNVALDSAGRVGIADLGGSITVDGTVTANAGTGPFPISDGGNVISVDDNAGSLTVDGSVGITGAVDTELPAAAALADAAANPTVPGVGSFGLAWNGSSWDRVRSNAALGGLVVAGTDARAAAISTKNYPVLSGGRAANYPASRPTSVTAGQLTDIVTDLEGVQIVRPRQVNTFSAIYRLALAAASSALSFAFTANTDKQLATIHHTSLATKRVVIRRVWVEIISSTVAGEVQLELRTLSAVTAPATGNPAITPAKRDQASSIAEAICLSLPTTAGSEVALNSPIASRILNLGATTTQTAPPLVPSTILLYDEASADDEEVSPIIRASNLEGYAVVGRSTAATTLKFITRIVFTEE